MKAGVSQRGRDRDNGQDGAKLKPVAWETELGAYSKSPAWGAGAQVQETSVDFFSLLAESKAD